MRQKSVTGSSPSERLVKTIRRATRKQYSAEEKIRIVLDGLRGSPALPSYAAGKGSPKVSTTAGRRSS
jgi:transposase